MATKQFTKEFVVSLIDRGYLPSPDITTQDTFEDPSLKTFQQSQPTKDKPLVISQDILQGILKQTTKGINWIEFEKSRVMYEKGTNTRPYTIFKTFLQGKDSPPKKIITENSKGPSLVLEQVPQEKVSQPIQQEILPSGVKIIKSYEDNSKKWEVKDFTLHYKKRYLFLQNVLQSRQELQNILSIHRIKSKETTGKIGCVGLVYDKRISKQGNTVITLEDTTGFITAIIKPTVKGMEDLCYDEVIGVTGKIHKGMIFVEEILFPDIPLASTKKQSPDEVFAAVISDIHVGSKNFLENALLSFIDWLNLEGEDKKQKAIAEKVKYLFVAGDLVAGIGVYPGQEKDLVIKDMRSQYVKLAEYLSLIRKDINIIICPGNHDATRLADPQPIFIKEFAAPLFAIPNIIFVSSPSLVNIHASKTFEGFNFLLYHGSSFHYYNNSISRLLLSDAKNNPSLTWKFLLKKRHLAPAHGSTVYVPNTTEDALLVDFIPDIVINGDVHKSGLDHYRGVMIISSSCWEKKSFVQERRGNEPDPGRVPLLNLKTREVSFLDFYTP